MILQFKKRKSLFYFVQQIKRIFEQQITIYNMLLIYRFLSLSITSIMYAFSALDKQANQKLFIIIGLFLAYFLSMYLYLNNYNNNQNKLILIIIETIWNSIFIIISGGFASPFIWYFINTVFCAMVERFNKVALFSAMVYFLVSTISTIFRIQQDFNTDVVILYLNTALSYIMIIGAIMQLIKYGVKIEEKSVCLSHINEELQIAKTKLENTIKYGFDICEAINIFDLDKSKNVLQEILDRIHNITGVDHIMFLQLIPFDKKGTFVSYGVEENDEREIALQVIELSNKIEDNNSPVFLTSNGKEIIVYYAFYKDNPCGALITINDKNSFVTNDYPSGNIDFSENNNDELYLQNLIYVFLKVAGIILKRLEFDEVSEQLLISEEQNRIANEIHDLVLQKLFAVSCKLYLLSNGNYTYEYKDLRKELQSIKLSVDNTMRELREAIYGFAWDKEGEDIFKKRLLKYIDEMKELLEVDIDSVIIGDTQKLQVNQKNGLYRVICEVINNAIRHGKANRIQLQIIINDTSTTVKITDDGIGFDYFKHLKNNDKGLGINNIFRVIELLNGHVEMNSQSTGGTEVILSIPSNPAA